MSAVAVPSMLDGLDREQRAAAELPDGPALIIAPAGSGKTTTLVARLGVLLERDVAAERTIPIAGRRELESDARSA